MTAKATMSRTMTGKVVSVKMNKAMVVSVERMVKHPRFGKFMRTSTKVHVHDAENQCQLGDLVVIKESRPISKTIRWALDSIKERKEK